jgi:hypothetical protein
MNEVSTIGKRVIIPHNVADAIESFRASTLPYTTAKIVAITQNEEYAWINAAALRTIPFDTLLAALVNGYEREKTPEEIAEEEWELTEERIRTEYQFRKGSEPTAYERGLMHGIEYTLDALGISISEVNA